LIDIVLFALTSFGVGLSGALVPGPMLTVTISDSVKKGFKAGPMVVLGHIMTETAMMILILAGLGWIIGSPTAALIIGIVGGLVLVLMGYNISKSKNSISNISYEDKPQKYGSVLGGVLTSVSNPFFFIWWATIGCAFMYKGLELAGIVGLLGFAIGHWSADISWYSMISFFSSKGSKIMSERTYKIIMIICGIFLVLLGVYFILSQINTFF
jgi:threonine/homoserine/homoserine lactone efflux protein